MGKFADALNRTAETIKRPPPPPIGLYVLRCVKMPDPPSPMAGKDGTNYSKLTVLHETLSPYEVDEDELAAYPGSPTGIVLRNDFIFNEDDDAKFEGTLVRLKEFLEKSGISTSSGTLSEWLSELPNTQVIGELKHRADPNDDKVIYSELGRVTAYT